MKSYAHEQALEALTRRWTDKSGHLCYSYDGERLAEVEAAINAVIERCARAADPVFNDGSHPCEGSLKRAAARIRALAAPPAGVGAPLPRVVPCAFCKGKRGGCEGCGWHSEGGVLVPESAPAGTGGRR